MFSNLMDTKDNLGKELYSLNFNPIDDLKYDKNNVLSYFNEVENLIIREFNDLSKTKAQNLKSIVHILQCYKEEVSTYCNTSSELSRVIKVPKEISNMFFHEEYGDLKKLISQVINNLKLINSIKFTLSQDNSILKILNEISNTKTFHNISVNVNGENIDLDEVIITKKGIFVLKAFNLDLDDSIFIEVTNDGKVFKHQGMHKHLISRNFKTSLLMCCKLLEKNINEKIKISKKSTDYIRVYPLGVLLNNDCKILNVSNIPLLKVKNLEKHLLQYKDILKDSDLDSIYNIASEFLTLKEENYAKSINPKLLDYLKVVLVSSKFLKEANEELKKINKDVYLKKKEEERRIELSKIRRDKLNKYKYIYIGFLVLGSLFIAYKSVSSIMLYSSIRDFNKNLTSSIELKDINVLSNIISNKNLTSSQKSAFITLLNKDTDLKKEIINKVSESKAKEQIKIRENIYLTEDKKLKLTPIKITRGSEGPIYLNEDKYTASYFEVIPGIYTVYSEKSGEKIKEKEIYILDETSLDLDKE